VIECANEEQFVVFKTYEKLRDGILKRVEWNKTEFKLFILSTAQDKEIAISPIGKEVI
jgi:hypothetical protein